MVFSEGGGEGRGGDEDWKRENLGLGKNIEFEEGGFCFFVVIESGKGSKTYL